MQQMSQEDIVIVGAGIAGLSTALGLHRSGIRSIVLESSDGLRITGFALTMWANAWRALDALGVGDVLRKKSTRVQGFQVPSQNPIQPSSEAESSTGFGECEIRCVKRRDLLETLEKELPPGTIRYGSKIVSIEKSGKFKLIHLADGSVLKTKALIGCDGVNSLVAKWLGLQTPVSAGRAAIRGFVHYPDGHGLEPKFHAYFGGGLRYGFIPCDEKSVYWFCTFTPSLFKYDENENDPMKLKQFVATNIPNVPKYASDVLERTRLDSISCAQLKFRFPWNILTGNIVKNNVTVAGDALHPMTPDIGQGGCSALEDSIILARCLAEGLQSKQKCADNEQNDEDHDGMKWGLEKYAKERRWRSFSLISMAYIVGMVQESNTTVMTSLRKLIGSRYTVATLKRMSDFDCGKLI